MSKSGSRFFYGWIIVAAGVVVTGGSVGVVNNTLSAFVKPVTEALGFSRGQFTFYNSIMSITGMLALPAFGELYRGPHMKRVMLGCAVLMGLVPWGYSFCTELWQFYLIAGVHGIMTQGVSFMAVTNIINNWFKAKKGLATGIAMAGTGLFGAVMVPIATRVIGSFGWQWGYRLTGTTAICLLVPTILFVIKIRPSDLGLSPLGAEGAASGLAAAVEPEGFTRAEALKMPSFRFIMAGFFMTCFVGNAMQAHAMSYLTDIGYESAVASGFMSVNMIALMAGKVILGAVYDRFGIMVGLISAAGGFATAAFLMGYAQSPVIAALAVSCQAYGFSAGSMSAGIIASRYFGSRDFSRIFSTISLASTASGIFGQPYPGFVFDLTGSYMPAWYFNIAVALCSTAFFFLAQRANDRDWARLAVGETAGEKEFQPVGGT